MSEFFEDQRVHPAVRGLRTVCRCHNIKQRTIEAAIRSGAVTVSAVAAATSATTGQCGGECTSRVIDLIEAIVAETPSGT